MPCENWVDQTPLRPIRSNCSTLGDLFLTNPVKIHGFFASGPFFAKIAVTNGA